MPRGSRNRVYGDRINFKSLACAPVNELGVVYLFGVLHELFDLSIESIQAGFPDCIARRPQGRNRWQEVAIEFEFESRSFQAHGHDSKKVDMIVCWKHNWSDCPEHIEVVELSSMMDNLGVVQSKTTTEKKLSEWQQYLRARVSEGLSFTEAAKQWKKKKKSATVKPEKTGKRPLTAWQKFSQEKRLEGLEFAEIGVEWRKKTAAEEKKSARKK